MNTTSAQTLTLTPSRYADDVDRHNSPNVIAVKSRYARGVVRLAVGFVGPLGSARQEQGGPLVPGPWAYTFPLSTVIDNNGGSGAEARRNREAGIEWTAEIGDLFEIDGDVYRLTDDRPHHYPALTRLV